MINELKPYKEYKESGVYWLGKIPEGWKLTRIKSEFNFIKEPSFNKEPIVLSLTKKGIKIRDISKNEGQIAKSYDGYNTIKKDYVILNPMDLESGAAATSKFDGVISNAYFTILPKDNTRINEKFYGEYFNMHYKCKIFYPLGRGVGRPEGSGGRWTLNRETFMKFPMVLPPKEEQDQIVKYLKFQLTKITKFIIAKKKLILVLKEQKQTIINQAVTRGLDPNTKMKTVGLDWLKEAPEHWEICKLKQVAYVQTGLTLGKKYDNRELIELPYIRVANVQDGHLSLNDISTISVPVEEVTSKTLQIGDVLMTEGGDRDKLGRGCIWNGEIATCLHQNHIFAVRTIKERLLPEYLTTIMTSQIGRIYFDITAKKTTNLASTNSTTLKAFTFSLPGYQEQRKILEYIDIKANSLVNVIRYLEKQIDLIEEYRTRLISDVVTGKMDVRGINIDDIYIEDTDVDEIEEEVVEDQENLDSEEE